MSFDARRETFGLDTGKPWAADALRLLFNAPRVYEPLARAWDERNPGTLRALRRLLSLGLVAYQGPVIINTRTGLAATRLGTPVARFRSTNKGARLLAAAEDDIRVLEKDTFPRTAPRNVAGVLMLLRAFDLEDSHRKFGLSIQHAADLSRMPASNVKWWVRRLAADGYLRELPQKLADTRAVVPAHWRATAPLARQLTEVIDAFDQAPDMLKVQYRLPRSRFLADIDPARVGISGATDFDHDVECQRIVAAFLGSPSSLTDGMFTIEPRFVLPLDTGTRPWSIHDEGARNLYYQPDAEMRETGTHGVTRSVIEYERFQTRRDAWNHVERFLGYLSTRTLPFEAAVLRFVVDSRSRERGYVELIEAFCDYALDHPERMPPNPVLLAVSSTPRLSGAEDPLTPAAWFRVELPTGRCADTDRRPVLHPADDSPYDEYFSRA